MDLFFAAERTARDLYLLGFVNGAFAGAFLMLLAALWVTVGRNRP